MTQKVRIGFVGAGGMAREHSKRLHALPDVEIAAVTDVSRPAAETLAASYGARVFDTPKQLAADGEVDALYILLPPFAHGEAEQAALAHRLPFFVEKPVGLDLGLAREVAAEVERAGTLTAAGYMNRYRRSVSTVRALLQQDPPILAYGGWWGAPPDPAWGGWWIDKSKSGGQFLEQVTHTVDLTRYLFGEAQEVFAYAAAGFNKNIPGYTIDDAVTVAIRFENGGIANLMASTSARVGDGVFLNLHSGSANFKFSGWEHGVTIRRQDEPVQVIPGEDNIFGIEDQAFVEALRTGDPGHVLSTYPDAVKTLAISVAANESIATGRPVAV